MSFQRHRDQIPGAQEEEPALPDKAAEYAPQIRAYAAALGRVLGLPVKEGVLFFLRTGESVSVPLKRDKGE